MTNAQLLEIGIQKRSNLIKTSWNDLVIQYCGTKFKDGEGYRSWVKREVKKTGSLNSKEVRNVLNSEEEQMKQKSTTEIHKDGSQSNDRFILMQEEDSKNADYLLRAHGYDTKVWELVTARSNIWNAYSKIDGKMNMYASKITVKPRTDSFSIEDIKDFFTELSKNYKSPVHTPTNYSYDGKMLELNIADLHLGKLCWSGDSNDTYNYEIARKRFFYIINDVLTRTKHYKFNKILFVWSNDFFHTDTISNTTTGLTRQDSDMRWQQMFKLGSKMLIEAIDLISQFAPVETFYIGSNHDKMTSFFATENLNSWYRDNSNIYVNTDAKSRKYVEFGKCLIGFTHGHAENKRVGGLMPIEAKEAWGRTSYREFHLAHLHSEKAYRPEKIVDEDQGVIVRHVSSPTATDTWHFESGYVGAIQKSMSFVWDKEDGLLDILNTTVKA
jgi:hypothetical protein